MNRTQFRQLAEERVRDAEALLNASQWSGAYYLAGYAVECGLKACVAKLTNQDDFPNKDLAIKSYTRRIEVLVEAAGLKSQRDADAIFNAKLGVNWSVVRDWGEASRYECWTELQARSLVLAVVDPTDGVLPWIMVRW